MQNRHIVIIDDDTALTELLTEYFEQQSYRISVCHDGRAGLDMITSRSDVDVVLLDVMMPSMDGFEVLRQLRQTHQTPVIMLTAKGDDYDRVLGLELGADDYLPKPFNHRELSARVKALLRRTENALHGSRLQDIRVGPLIMSPAKQTVLIDEKPLTLTAYEFTLLRLLMINVSDLVSKEMISEQVLGRRMGAFDRSIDMHVSNVRKKLAQLGVVDAIKTVRGSGYILRELE